MWLDGYRGPWDKESVARALSAYPEALSRVWRRYVECRRRTVQTWTRPLT